MLKFRITFKKIGSGSHFSGVVPGIFFDLENCRNQVEYLKSLNNGNIYGIQVKRGRKSPWIFIRA